MDFIADLWDRTTDALNSLSEGVSDGLIRVFGNANERTVRRMRPAAARINELEPGFLGLSNEQLKGKTIELRRRLEQGASLEEILPEAFAACRESGRRFLNMRHYDVQLLGGMVLHGGSIAEMVTGEGKTLVATLAAYLNALEGRGVHVVTVNDYLARRDAEWMNPLYTGLGLSVGAIQSQMESGERKRIYNHDITYGTNNEFGFDYLRDNMKPSRDMQSQRKLHYAIIDEVDSILVDEARTPLIISGPAFDDVDKYRRADEVARKLKKGVHFEVKEKERTAHLTDEGVREAEHLAGIESFYTPGNMEWPHLIDNSLKAHFLYRRDRDYVVLNGDVVIVDEFTGRLMTGRQWSDGLHQAVEAKERVRVKEETQTLATITLQNYFKLYKKLAGMTGTAMTEANEFWKVYSLDVIAIPTNQTLIRTNHPDVVYRTEQEKYQSIIDEIREVHKEGRPSLVGTTSIEKSELISEMLQKFGIPHQVLNAKYHEFEAEIVAQAGRKGMVTIATNMAGRGTDIILGGNPEFMAWSDLKRLNDADGRPLYPTRLEVPPEVWRSAVMKYEDEMKAEGRVVASVGGLHVIGTERHESRRIDNQLRGRTGRQGDPGSSRFFLSLEDDLMRKFAGEWVKNVLTRLGMQEGEAIVSSMVSRRIEGAQKKVEERNFDARKNLLEYDEVMDEQRKRVYGFRQRLLDGYPAKDEILEMIDQQIGRSAETYLADDYGVSTFADFVGTRLGIELQPKEFKNARFDDAIVTARAEAESQLPGQISEALEENLPSESDPEEWNWQALTSWANARFNVNLKERDLRQYLKSTRGELELDRSGLEEMLASRGVEHIRQVELEEARPFLDGNFGRRVLAGWFQHKFGVSLDPEAWVGRSRNEVAAQLEQAAREHYTRKEAEFPARIAFSRFLGEKSAVHGQRLDREGLAAWASQRLGTMVDPEELRPLLRSEIEKRILGLATERYQGERVARELESHLERVYPEGGNAPAGTKASAADLTALASWAHENLGVETTADELVSLPYEGIRNRLINAFDARYRPEMREVEKILLLQFLDGSWMEHLRGMDHLRSSVGLRGYAQVDPKVEYKREGMKLFEEMWSGVGDKVTDLIFRVETFDPEFLNYLGSRWQLGRARMIHDNPAPAAPEEAQVAAGGNIRAQQEAAISASQSSSKKAEPIRNLNKKVGRNDPCPCGSGRKYKVCCMRKGGDDLF